LIKAALAVISQLLTICEYPFDVYSVNLIPPPKPSVIVISETSVMLRWVLTPRDVVFVKVQYKRLKNGRSSSGLETVDEDLQATTQSFEVTRLQSG